MMSKKHWRTRLGLALVGVALISAFNPEVRVLLLLLDSIGLDLALLLIATQLRWVAPFVTPMLTRLTTTLGYLAASAGRYAFHSMLPALLCIVLPRLAPALLVWLLFLIAASEIDSKRRPDRAAARLK